MEVCLHCSYFLTGTSSDKSSTAAPTPTAVSTSTPTPVNDDSTDEMIRKNRERMMKKMAGKSPNATSAGFVIIIVFHILYSLHLLQMI